jgi:hypothetical protein
VVVGIRAQHGGHRDALHEPLEGLGRDGRKLPAVLDGGQGAFRHRGSDVLGGPERLREHVGGGHGVLDGEVDPDAPER